MFVVEHDTLNTEHHGHGLEMRDLTFWDQKGNRQETAAGRSPSHLSRTPLARCRSINLRSYRLTISLPLSPRSKSSKKKGHRKSTDDDSPSSSGSRRGASSSKRSSKHHGHSSRITTSGEETGGVLSQFDFSQLSPEENGIKWNWNSSISLELLAFSPRV
ncbi:hypothetical protein FSARC_6970 [Fusarium sarcochroum]|uniref:Uncharacterized protein n=1 Tax=Fusarium sarcochroum TaxID=1208366 RepID=A0A8H4X7V7_9HYPO|nr:hypothetical protein FSARC_6970 [Fusarium sarcochroum]